MTNRIRLATEPPGHTQCNHCRTCVPDAEFPAHWEACPERQRLGYIAPVIASPS